MFIIFPKCSFKCDREAGTAVCQNSDVAALPDVQIEEKIICERYLKNPITHAIVCGGLEPFDTFEDLENLIAELRENYLCRDDIVIYTGYTEEEIKDQIEWLKQWSNIIIKFGRFIPNQKQHKDEVLGIMLASDNQYAKRIS